MPYKTALTFTYDCGEFEGNMQEAADTVRPRHLRGTPDRSGNPRQAARHRPVQLHRGRRRSVPAPGQGSLDVAARRGRHADPALRFDVGGAGAGDDHDPACRRPLRRGRSNRCGGKAATPICCPAARATAAPARCASADRRSSLAVDKVIERRARSPPNCWKPPWSTSNSPSGRFTIAGTDRSVVVDRCRPRRARSRPYPARRGRRPGGIRRIHPDRRHLPQRHPYLRGRNRSRNRRHRNRRATARWRNSAAC